MARELSPSRPPAGDPLFGAEWAAAGAARQTAPWSLTLLNAVAVGAVFLAISYRIFEAKLPANVFREELVLIGAGVVLTAIAVAVRISTHSTRLAAQLPIMGVATLLAVLVLGAAGRWLGDDLPPLAAVAFATVFLQFDVGLHSKHFGYVFGIAIIGLGVLWFYAVTQLMVSINAVVIWTLVLVGLGLLAGLISRSVQRDLGLQVERQGSLLATLSDLGEGIIITEKGRFVAANDAYIKLTGFTREELAAMPSMIEMAPPEDRERLTASLSARLAGGDAPARYTSAIVTKSGARVEVEVAIHQLTKQRHQALTLVSDISERRRAEQAERDLETRFRTLFEQAQAGMAFTSLDGHITTVNPAFCELVGYSSEELRTLSLLDITHPDDVAGLHDAMAAMLTGDEEGRRIEKRYVRKDGENVWVDLTTCDWSVAVTKSHSTSRRSRSTSATASARKCCRRLDLLSPRHWSRRRVGTRPRPRCSKGCAERWTGSSPSTGRSTRGDKR